LIRIAGAARQRVGKPHRIKGSDRLLPILRGEVPERLGFVTLIAGSKRALGQQHREQPL
jgi:hypothetical protein